MIPGVVEDGEIGNGITVLNDINGDGAGDLVIGSGRIGNDGIVYVVYGEGDTIRVVVEENSTFVMDVDSTDPDGEIEGIELSYEINGVDGDLFEISSSGELTFKAAPDFEAAGDDGGNNIYNIDVTVRDLAGATDTRSMEISVVNVNEAPIISGYSPLFIENVITDTGNRVYSSFAVDMDGDTDIDVVSVSNGNRSVSWHENDGSQNFSEHVISNSVNGASYVYAADLDNDGDQDIISAAFYGNNIAWYENDGLADPTAAGHGKPKAEARSPQ
ncbi:MAG: hypothetical protein GY821_01510 [Gammaproteobacteria bacterium]|nr:hypothetical protein [Gammaproteobacteria bacterium]